MKHYKILQDVVQIQKEIFTLVLKWSKLVINFYKAILDRKGLPPTNMQYR